MTSYVYLKTRLYQGRIRRRVLIFSATVVATITVVGLTALMLGDYPLTLAQTFSAVVGQATDHLANFFVRDIRLPRVLGAVLVGVSLGVAGAIFQALTHNPLGSPDITGFSVGAATGAVVQIIVFNTGPFATGVAAIVGGLLTGAIVFGFSRSSGINGIHFVLVGMGLSFILQALNTLLLVKAELSAAQTAQLWLAGSLHGIGWSQVGFLALVLAFLLPLTFAASGDLTIMTTGDDVASGLGVNVQAQRGRLLALGVTFTAVSVAVAGPIGFVALAAPQLARKISGTATAGVGVAALMGAVVVLVSDVIAQRLFAPTQLPVGVITGVVGGVYLMWILYREWKGHWA